MGLRDYSFNLSYGPSDDRLHAFYIPALSASIRYDRMTGFFTSSALAVAAAGVAHLIANGGQMRLLVGAQLEPDDVEAIRAGHDLREAVAACLSRTLPDPETLADQIMRDRLAALAWMVAAGSLEIRVVLPKGPDGLPIPAPEARDYFHPKVGIFTDAQGNQVAFSGSVNESETGWQHNYEQFMVFCSWAEGRVYVAEALGRFERLWAQREPDWVSLPIPEAVRQKLLRYTPATAPTRDPLERAWEEVRERVSRMVLAPALQQERIICQFLRDAPYLVGATGLGAATCAIVPWPHQQVVSRQVLSTYPTRYLLADEVGLGKTIEAGLVLRQLWLSGIVRRALILAPKSVLRQWQEELYEKFALNVPIYDGAVFRDIWGNEHTPTTLNPWDGVELALASSQLVKREERRRALLEARPWDLVIVDEAHHARRRDFLDLSRYRPNRLLELLNPLQARTRGLLLMTATPMQVHPIEVWDLLNLLGLSDEWGADGRHFLRFYDELRRPLDEADWSFIFRLLRSELAMNDGQLDPQLEAQANRELGPVDWAQVRTLVDDPDPGRVIQRLSPKARLMAVTLVKRHTPLRRLVFRNTRPLLREYVRQGLLTENVPHRQPHLEWIPMRQEERALYERIEEYITRFYRKYENERKGLGFVMTVYRRRLTSSFYAVQQSLKRRLAFLRGKAGLGLVEDDLEQEELSLDVDELDLADRALFHEEIEYVEDFVHALGTLGGNDSKVEQLLKDLRQIFRQRDTVIVFTQYTDTMDFLREQLRQSYGTQVACYSGRGGERWDGVMWVPVTKEEIKNAFREGEAVKILLCTEAASEGINLQTCGVLINYDMPWNPMRVEQRIGRIDRIGQRYERVWIRNYFYENTVEARVYQALARRINWFQDVVGPLQPILAHVGRTIQTLAMVPEAERQEMLRAELAHIQAELDNMQAVLDLDEWAGKAQGVVPVDTPLTLPELAHALTTAPTLQGCFRPHETIANAFWVRCAGREVAVTFDPATFDAYPDTLQLLTFGNPLLAGLLEQIPAVELGQDGSLLRLSVEAPWPRVAYYALDAGQPRRLDRLADVRAVLAASPVDQWSEEAVEAARRDLQRCVEAEWESMRQAQARLEQAQRSALASRAARLLLDAALVELALGQQPDLFTQEAYPGAFNQTAVVGLKRHGYPWTALLKIAGSHLQSPHPIDPFFVEIQNEPADRLQRRFETLRQRAERLLQEIGPG
ncbi:MAG: helicase-related protein [Anaerolineae bacterium]|jgi:superfamily II DNA or RNA helicase|nr:helicase-related protein [Anaerolineae bacterium]MDH7473997.1 helicase-related protein [Anaerolineae bacterium]